MAFNIALLVRIPGLDDVFGEHLSWVAWGCSVSFDAFGVGGARTSLTGCSSLELGESSDEEHVPREHKS